MANKKTISETPSISPRSHYALKSVADLAANPRNARTHSDKQIGKIAASIKAFGFLNPIIIDANGVIIAGHGRLEASKKLGLEEVPTLLADHLTDAEKRAYMLADNQIATESGWDNDLLKIELSELEGLDFDLSLTGFDDFQIDAMLHPSSEIEGENDVPELEGLAVSKLGDVWLLGPHRVRCGDSCDPDGVAALLNGAKPHLMVTDPPYGVEYDPNWRNLAERADGSKIGASAVGQVKNDGKADWREAWSLFPGDVAYVWHAGKFGGIVQESLEQTDFDIRSQIIWAKSNMAISRGDYHWKHEPCLYAVRKGKNGHWNGDRKQTTVWEIDKPQKSETGHSTQKPVECMRRPIINNSVKGDAVYDPFLGSGTTLIAAETEGRICYGMELNPAYVDVIVRRYQEFTGKKATRESDGAYFDNLKPEKVAA